MKSKLLESSSLLFLLAIFLVVANFEVIFNLDIEASRIARVLSFITLCVVLLLKRSRLHLSLAILLGLLLLRDLSVLNYEIEVFKTLTFICTIMAYLMIIYLAIRKLNLRKFKSELTIFTVLLVLLNLFNVYYLSDVVATKLTTDFQLILFYAQGTVILFMGLVAYLYFDSHQGTGPLLYVYLVSSFIASDLFGLAAYYFEYFPAYYTERLFYLVGITLTMYHAINEKREFFDEKRLVIINRIRSL